METLFTPIMEKILPYMEWFEEKIDNMTEAQKLWVGGIVVSVGALASLLTSLAMLGLAWFGFTQMQFTMPKTLLKFSSILTFIPKTLAKIITKMTTMIGLQKGLSLVGLGGSSKGLAKGGLVGGLGIVGLLLSLPLLKKAWDENLYGIQDKVKNFKEWFKTVDWGEIWNNLITTMKETLSTITEILTVVYEEIVKWVMSVDWDKVWQNVLESAKSVFGKITEVLDKTLTIMTSWFKNMLDGFTIVLDGIKGMLDKMFSRTKGWYKRQDWDKNWESMFEWTTKIIGYMGTFVSNMFSSMKSKIKSTNWSEIFTSIFNITSKLLNIIARFAGILIGSLLSALIKFIKALPDITSMIWDVITGKKRAEAKFLESTGGIKGLLGEVGGEFLTGFKSGFTAFADGGIVTRPTAALIGEAGPEAVIPLNKMGGMGTTVHIHNPIVRNDGDINKIAEQVGRVLEDNRRRFR